MKLKAEMALLAGALDNGITPTRHWDFIYLYGELFSSKIFKHKLSYEFVDLLEFDLEKREERNKKVTEILSRFEDFKFDIAKNIRNLSLEELSTFDATSYHIGVKSTIWELPTQTFSKYRTLVTKEQWFCYMYLDDEKGILYFANDKKELWVIIPLYKKPETLF